jgi:hypothetical protein
MARQHFRGCHWNLDFFTRDIGLRSDIAAPALLPGRNEHRAEVGAFVRGFLRQPDFDTRAKRWAARPGL